MYVCVWRGWSMCVVCVGGVWCVYVCVRGVVCVWEGVSEEKGNVLGTRDQHNLHAQDTPSPAAPHIPGNGEFLGMGMAFQVVGMQDTAGQTWLWLGPERVSQLCHFSLT